MVYSLQCLIHLHRSHAALDQPQQDVLRLCPLGCDTTRHRVVITHIAFVVAEGGVTQEIQHLQMLQNSPKHHCDDGEALVDV